jgi:hypothetical protein
MSETYLTLDLATMSGYCLWTPRSKPVIGNSDLGTWYSNNYPKALAIHYKRMKALIEENEVSFVCYERPMMRHTDTQNKLQSMYGLPNVIQLLEGQMGFTAVHVGVSEWRKHVLGHGQLSTDVAKNKAMAIAKGCGLDPKTHDAAEAFCIMDYLADVRKEKKDWKDPINFRFKL